MASAQNFYARRRKRQSGVSLIEVLVSIVLLSFGIVGLAGLQFHGSRVNHSAYLRSQATNLAADAADRMRANRAAVADYSTGRETVFNAANGPPCDAVLGVVTALRDVNQWKSCLETLLPGGRGRISELVGGDDDYTDDCGVTHAAHNDPGRRLFVIEVTWSNARLQNENALECLVFRTEVGPLS